MRLSRGVLRYLFSMYVYIDREIGSEQDSEGRGWRVCVLGKSGILIWNTSPSSSFSESKSVLSYEPGRGRCAGGAAIMIGWGGFPSVKHVFSFSEPWWWNA